MTTASTSFPLAPAATPAPLPRTAEEIVLLHLKHVLADMDVFVSSQESEILVLGSSSSEKRSARISLVCMARDPDLDDVERSFMQTGIHTVVEAEARKTFDTVDIHVRLGGSVAQSKLPAVLSFKFRTLHEYVVVHARAKIVESHQAIMRSYPWRNLEWMKRTSGSVIQTLVSGLQAHGQFTPALLRRACDAILPSPTSSFRTDVADALADFTRIRIGREAESVLECYNVIFYTRKGYVLEVDEVHDTLFTQTFAEWMQTLDAQKQARGIRVSPIAEQSKEVDEAVQAAFEAHVPPPGKRRRE